MGLKNDGSGPVVAHAGLSDPHTGYRLESADLTHLSSGLQGGLLTPAALGGDTGWTAWTPTVTQSGAIVTWTLNSCFYKQIGKTVFWRANLTVNDAGTATGANTVTVTLPVTAAFRTALGAREMIGHGRLFDTSASLNYPCQARLNTATSLLMVSVDDTVANSALGAGKFTAALATGDLIDLAGTYEAA